MDMDKNSWEQGGGEYGILVQYVKIYEGSAKGGTPVINHTLRVQLGSNWYTTWYKYGPVIAWVIASAISPMNTS